MQQFESLHEMPELYSETFPRTITSNYLQTLKSKLIRNKIPMYAYSLARSLRTQ